MDEPLRERITDKAYDAGSDFAHDDRLEDEDLGPEDFADALRREVVIRSDPASAFVAGVDSAFVMDAEAERFEAVRTGIELVRSAFDSEGDPDADDIPEDWSLSDRVSTALEFVIRWAYVEGDHHKQWVIDRMIRVLVGPEGHEEFKILYNQGTDGPDTYDWEENVVGP